MLPLEPQDSGSPSRRSWKAFYARTQTYDVKHHAESYFQYAISALRWSKSVVSLSFFHDEGSYCNGLAESVLHQPAMTQILRPNTFANMEVFSIIVGAKDRKGVDDAKEVLGVLRTMLSYMRSPKKLDLTFLPYSFCTGGPSPDTTTYE